MTHGGAASHRTEARRGPSICRVAPGISFARRTHACMRANREEGRIATIRFSHRGPRPMVHTRHCRVPAAGCLQVLHETGLIHGAQMRPLPTCRAHWNFIIIPEPHEKPHARNGTLRIYSACVRVGRGSTRKHIAEAAAFGAYRKWREPHTSGL